MWIWTRITWPDKLLTETRDEKGVFFGNKSTALESVGMLLPFVAFPEKISGRYIVFKIDNEAVAYGWESGYVKNDRTASEILTCVHYMASCLGVTVYVEHVDRMSDGLSSLADELSRRKTAKNRKIQEQLENTENRTVEGYLLQWLENPLNGNVK